MNGWRATFLHLSATDTGHQATVTLESQLGDAHRLSCRLCSCGKVQLEYLDGPLDLSALGQTYGEQALRDWCQRLVLDAVRERDQQLPPRDRFLGDSLSRINQLLHRTLDLNTITQMLVEEGSRALGSDTAAVTIMVGDEWEITHVYRTPAEWIGMRMGNDLELHALHAVTTRQPVVITDGFTDERFNREHLRKYNIRSVLVCPLILQDEPFGCLFFNYHTDIHHFTEDEVTFGAHLAATASIAMHNAKLYAEAREHAEEIRRAHDKLENVINGVTDGVAVLDPSMRLIEISEPGARILGMRPEALLGQTATALFHPEHGRAFLESFLKAQRSRTQVHFEAFCGAPVNKWLECHCYPGDEGVSVYFQDISERKNAEQVSNFLAAIVESSEDAIISKDLNGRILSWNKAAERLFGYTAEEIVGDTVARLHPSQLDEETPHILDRIRQGEKVLHLDTQRVTKSGRVIDVFITISPIRNSEGEILGASKIIRDISDYKKAQRDLLAAQQRTDHQRRLFEAVLSNTPDLAWVQDLDGRFVYVNEGFIQLFDRPVEDLLGYTYEEIGVRPEHTGIHVRSYQEVIRTKQPVRGEVIFGDRALDFIFVPVLNADGEVEVVAGTTRDITEHKRIQRDLMEERENLQFALQAAGFGQFDFRLTDMRSTHSLLHDTIFGYAEPIEDWNYDRFLSHIIDEDREATHRALKAAIHDRQKLDIECRIRRADGDLRWVWINARIHEDPETGTERLIGLIGDITDKKEADNRLRTSQNRLRMATDAAELGIWVWDCESDEVVFENARCSEILGFDPTLKSLPARQLMADFLLPEYHQDLNAAVRASMRSGRRMTFVGQVRQEARRKGWIELNASPQSNPKTQTMAFHGVIRDVTDEMLAQEQAARLAKSNALIRTSFEQGPQFAAMLSLDGRISEVNRMALDSSGFQRREVISQLFHRCGWWARSSEVSDRVQAVVAMAIRGIPSRLETRYFWADGTERFMDLAVAPVIDDEGRVLNVYCAGNDITDKHRAEAALRESEERFRLMADAAPVLIWISDTEKQCTWFNKTWLEFVGRSMEEEIGDGWVENVHPEDVEKCMNTFHGSFNLRRPFTMDYRMRHHNGEYRWILDVGVPRLSQSGEFVGYIGSCIDITERKQMEGQILMQAAQIADQSRRKDEFLAMLSHELRNPLAPIQSAVQLLQLSQNGHHSPAEAQAREVIARQVGALGKLVNELLEISRVVSGRIQLDRRVVDFNQIIQHALETSSPHIRRKDHHVHLALPPEPTWVIADPTRLEEVFVNLLNNAAKYTHPEGEIEIESRVAGDRVVLVVRDNGIGIEPELLPRIFDIFTQADRSLDRSEGGLGIGLSLASRLLEMHGGTLEAVSPPPGRSVGSEFIVTLPLESALNGPEPEAAPALKSEKKMRLLLVDDNEDLVHMLTILLQLHGHEVKSTHNGVDALLLVPQWNPEAVLLDIGLPGMNGLEVARNLRLDYGDQFRIIALTGYGSEADVAAMMNGGFDGHLVKPFDYGQLEELLARTEPEPAT